MPELLIATGGVGIAAAAAALWLEGPAPIGRRYFAGLLALALASSFFRGAIVSRIAGFSGRASLTYPLGG